MGSIRYTSETYSGLVASKKLNIIHFRRRPPERGELGLRVFTSKYIYNIRS